MMRLLIQVLLCSLLFQVKAQVSQIKLSDIRHATVGDTVILHCNEKIAKKENIDVERIEIVRKKSQGEETGISYQREVVAQRSHFYYFPVSVTVKPKLDITLVLTNVTPSESGLYLCKIWPKKEYTPLIANIMELFVHGESPCHDNWIWIEESKSCMRAMLDSMNWQEAREFCQYHHNADLIKIKSNAVDQLVSSITGLDYHFWIGMRREKGAQHFRWYNETEKKTYHTYWAIDYPVDADYDTCVSKGGYDAAAWRNLDCEEESSVICERGSDKKSVWRPPPLWKTVVASLVLLVVLVGISLCFFNITPDRNAAAGLLHFLGRKDVKPRLRRNFVVVLYESDLDKLFD
ncbi:hypothetical protein EGW08_020098 [Elysia chlorotica]|uniref:C-type lectin domain-containing protein n=1 Tax=Elysia chlorotica TaxID=188477 RepID=A0A433SSA8_ELYCH|nr:hypothetical protein EGW08_020098 [Elysia chlorotica]